MTNGQMMTITNASAHGNINNVSTHPRLLKLHQPPSSLYLKQGRSVFLPYRLHPAMPYHPVRLLHTTLLAVVRHIHPSASQHTRPPGRLKNKGRTAAVLPLCAMCYGAMDSKAAVTSAYERVHVAVHGKQLKDRAQRILVKAVGVLAEVPVEVAAARAGFHQSLGELAGGQQWLRT